MKRRLSMLLVLLLLVPMLAKADTPYPVIGEPVLKDGSQWVKTDWGYQSRSLTVDSSHTWPTVYTMEGYSGASRPSPNAYLRMDDGELMALRISFGQGPTHAYALVQASIRGTECSGGSFNLYDRRHAWDGYHIIEWIAGQPWSDTNVGMFGSSFPGQTAYWVATTNPPHLKAVSANLLHSDIYRDIFMPGGVQNYLFPTLWTYAAGPHRAPQDSLRNGTMQNDEICVQNQATRYFAGDLPQPENEPAWAVARSVDDDWYAAHAALTYAGLIHIPYYQQVDWQDEQVGPRAVVLFHHVNPYPTVITGANGFPRVIVPKKFVVSNGDHGFGNFAGRDRWAFFDIFLRGMPDSTGLMSTQITHYFETDDNGHSVATKSGNTWPHERTTYTRWYTHDGGRLDTTGPAATEGTETYAAGAPRSGYFYDAPDQRAGSEITTARGLPDEVAYQSKPFDTTSVIAGPLSMDLYASLAGTDADFFVRLSDVFPDGRVSYLQRGLLKASHRAIDPLRSYYDTDQNGNRIMVQPYRPHTNPQPVLPGEINKYTIEIFPLGYIVRPGHRLLVQIQTPPAVDGLWGYTPVLHQPAAVTLYHDAAHPSSLLLPTVTTDAPIPSGDTPCPLPGGFPCTDPSPLR